MALISVCNVCAVHLQKVTVQIFARYAKQA